MDLSRVNCPVSYTSWVVISQPKKGATSDQDKTRKRPNSARASEQDKATCHRNLYQSTHLKVHLFSGPTYIPPWQLRATHDWPQIITTSILNPSGLGYAPWR
jgi:hypothetical protein